MKHIKLYVQDGWSFHVTRTLGGRYVAYVRSSGKDKRNESVTERTCAEAVDALEAHLERIHV